MSSVLAVFKINTSVNYNRMNIIRENIDELNTVLTIKLEKNDYEEKVSKVLKDYQRKANVHGFRPGKVPFGLINKMYHKQILIEEVNKMISEGISKYMVDEKLKILGEPLPHIDDTKTIDWDNDTEFEFKLDLGMAPEIDVKVTAKDKIPFYNIKVDKDLLNKYIDNYASRFGEYVKVDVAEEKDLVKAEIIQLDMEGNPLDGGVKVEETPFLVEMIKDQDIKKQFIGIKAGDIVDTDLKKAFPSDAEISSMLKIKKERVVTLEGKFRVIVKEVNRFNKAEINQALFDKVFGEGNVKSEEEFKEKMKDEAAKVLVQDSEYRFKIDAKNALLKKFKGNLPGDFLKRWLFTINEGKFTKEDIDKDYDHFEEDLKWQLLKDHLAAENQLQITDDDLKKSAIEYTRAQFSQYGMSNLPDAQLEEFAKRMLEREEDKNKISNSATENKIIEFVKNNAKVEETEITTEKFNKLFEN
jgi:trigger factor